MVRELKTAVRLRDDCGFKLLYALKPLTFEFVLELMTSWVDGFATSSLFESRLRREVIGHEGLGPRHNARASGRPRAARARPAVRLGGVQFALAVAAACAGSSTARSGRLAR